MHHEEIELAVAQKERCSDSPISLYRGDSPVCDNHFQMPTDADFAELSQEILDSSRMEGEILLKRMYLRKKAFDFVVHQQQVNEISVGKAQDTLSGIMRTLRKDFCRLRVLSAAGKYITVDGFEAAKDLVTYVDTVFTRYFVSLDIEKKQGFFGGCC